MPRFVSLTAFAAVLATYAVASADIQRHVLGTEVELRLVLAKGEPAKCAVRAWDGAGLEGSCGSIRWEELKSGTAFRVLKDLVAAKPALSSAPAAPAAPGAAGSAAPADGTTPAGANERAAGVNERAAGVNERAAGVNERASSVIEDAATVALSLAEPGTGAAAVLEWARKSGVDAAGEARVRAEADRLRAERESRRRAERDAELARRTPEAAAFARQPWIVPPPGDFEVASRASLEAARALLAGAGGSATLHETKFLSVLSESGDDAYRAEAAALESAAVEGRGRIEAAGLVVAQQGRIPVVFVSDLDRWRLLVTSAFGGDPAAHRESFAVYPEGRAIVFVAPEGDAQRRRFAACAGVARALVHYTGAPQRPTAWINEGLPLVLADLAVPGAARDAELRRAGLAHLRGGGSFAPILRAGYGDAVWTRDAALARSLSYMLMRYLYERGEEPATRFAKADIPGAADDNARFQRLFGQSLASGVATAERWFRTND